MTHPFLLLDWLCEQANIHLARHVTYAWLAMLILIIIAFLVSRRLKELPGGLQNLMEAAIGGLENFIVETMGSEGLAYFPLIGTLAFFILTCNLIALVPGGYPATANLNTNAAMALTVFAATHYVGLKEHGFGYVKHFLGPVPILAPLIFVIEIISHLSRPLSLSLRLFGNMYGHEIVLMIFLFLVPIIIPIPVILLGVLVAFIQTFVFTLLAMIYIAGALEEAH